MEIREGYKQTEVGVIPEEWGLDEIGSVTSKIGSGITPTGGNRVYQRIGRPFVRSQNVHYGNMNLKEIVYIDENTHKFFEGTEIQKDDVLLNITGASIGRSSVADLFVIGGNVNQHVCILRPFKRLMHPHYLCYYILSFQGQKYIDNFQAGGNRQGLNFKQIASIKIPMPLLPEQQAIATALSDIDGLINSLQKLIDKKKKIKQGAMQVLLKPKDEWVQKDLGEKAVLKARIGWQGLTTAEYKETGDFFLITGTDFKNGLIDWSNCCYVDKHRYNQDRNIQVKVDDVLVTKDGTIGKVAIINDLPKPATLNSGVFVIRPIQHSFHPQFFYYVLLSEAFDEFLAQLSAGSTITHLYQKDFVNFKFLAPPTLEEQASIATVLSDMDSEIETLERKLNKYRDIKQGMMQELLTGRIRLLEEAVP